MKEMVGGDSANAATSHYFAFSLTCARHTDAPPHKLHFCRFLDDS